MENQPNNGKVIYSELDTDGGIIECPSCHAILRPHLGHLMAPKFECLNCKSDLSYVHIPGKTVRCPCCNLSRPLPNSLQVLFCGGCHATIVYQKGDQAVKCSLCKHITTPPQETFGLRPVNRGPPPFDHMVHPQANQVFPPQANQVDHPQANHVVPPQANQLVRPQVYRGAPSQGNQVVPNQANRREEGESSGSRSNIRPQAQDEMTLEERAIAATFIAETLMTVARAYGSVRRGPAPRAKDGTEQGRSKKRSRDPRNPPRDN